MYLIVTIHMGNKSYDIGADDNLPVSKAVQSLRESLKTGAPAQQSEYYRLPLQNRIISIYETFSDAGIRNGDMLIPVATGVTPNPIRV